MRELAPSSALSWQKTVLPAGNFVGGVSELRLAFDAGFVGHPPQHAHQQGSRDEERHDHNDHDDVNHAAPASCW
jgi:hypothetical protein